MTEIYIADMRSDVMQQLKNLEGMTLEQAMNLDTFNYTVGYRRLFYPLDPMNLNSPQIQSPYHIQLVREDNCAPLNVVGETYGIVQHREGFAIANDLAEEGGNRPIRGGSIGNGERAYLILRGREEIMLGEGHRATSMITLSNSFGFDALTAHIGTYRSDNRTLVQMGAIKIRHTAHVLDRLAEKKKILRGMAKYWSRYKEAHDRLARCRITDEQAKTYFLGLVPGKEGTTNKRAANIRERMFKLYKGEGMSSKLPNAMGTMWGAYSAAIEDCEYYRTVKTGKKRDRVSQEIYSRINGDLARAKAEAFDMALDMAESFGSFLTSLTA